MTFQSTSAFLNRRKEGPTTPHLPEGIQFALIRVQSPLITESLLISLPAGTKMLQSPAFPILNGLQSRKSHSEIPGSMTVCVSPGLIAAYHVLHRRSKPSHSPDRVIDNSRHLDNTRYGGLCTTFTKNPVLGP
ncbi:hypothetical protein MMKA1_00260 [Methanococcus maripaludis KA1]|uniref:Uncharacterized protein n=1 Tax=Methanococcus maripaludis KA1 TaxID=637914 RepID=A0A2Z5PE42_METMI|nr:hypothetical protein MMKA1_00260 [Methanococcus maripaludis KA1]